MAVLAWIFATLGGLCAVVGIITATESVSLLNDLGTQFTAVFWLTLAATLLLVSIVAALFRTSYD